MDPSYRMDEFDQRAERDAHLTAAHTALDDAKVPRMLRGIPMGVVQRINYIIGKYCTLQVAYKELVGQYNALQAEYQIMLRDMNLSPYYGDTVQGKLRSTLGDDAYSTWREAVLSPDLTLREVWRRCQNALTVAQAGGSLEQIISLSDGAAEL